MNFYLKSAFLFFTALTFISCEDVVDVELSEAPPRLVIEASIDWEKGTRGQEQNIKLSTSSPYYDNNINTTVTGASVRVRNDETGAEFLFTDQSNGNYHCLDFVPVLNNSYTLEIIHNDNTYTAQETMTPVTNIVEVNQSATAGEDDKAIEVNVLFDDPADQENFYLFKFQRTGDRLPQLIEYADEFTDGNRTTVWFEKVNEEDPDDEDFVQEELLPGEIVQGKMHGISERYYQYMQLLISQYDIVGELFSATPVALKGNCINPDDPADYALGYFRLTQVVSFEYTIE